MEHAEASKISLYSVADYTWNMSRYDSDASWRRAVKDLMPLHAEYLETFATHNSDLGPNGHNFRRDESVAIQPALATLLNNYREKGQTDDAAYREVAEECRKIIVAADMLLASGNENRPLINEIRPWLTQFRLVGEYGKEVLEMMRLQPQKKAFVRSHAHAQALQRLMCETDALYHVGVKSAGKHLLPTFDALFEVATSRYNKLFDAQLDTQAVYSPYSLESDVVQLASLPVKQKGKTVNIAPSNEVIDWQAAGSLTLSMDYARNLNSLLIDLGSREAIDSLFRLEVTADGAEWQPVQLQPYGSRSQLKAVVAGLKVLKVRLVNVSGADRKVYFKMFRFVEK